MRLMSAQKLFGCKPGLSRGARTMKRVSKPRGNLAYVCVHAMVVQVAHSMGDVPEWLWRPGSEIFH